MVELKKFISKDKAKTKVVLMFPLKEGLDNEELIKRINSKITNTFGSFVSLMIYHYGDFNSFKEYGRVVSKFRQKHSNGKSCYRNYCRTEEEQRKTMLFVNVAEDPMTSYKTAVTAVRAPHGVILEVIL